MPEDRAFATFLYIMYDLGHRDIFKGNFERLEIRLHQLDRLLEDNMPDLWEHFQKSGVASRMYATDWIVTLFTNKFALFLVFEVMDVFLTVGFSPILQVR